MAGLAGGENQEGGLLAELGEAHPFGQTPFPVGTQIVGSDKHAELCIATVFGAHVVDREQGVGSRAPVQVHAGSAEVGVVRRGSHHHLVPRLRRFGRLLVVGRRSGSDKLHDIQVVLFARPFTEEQMPVVDGVKLTAVDADALGAAIALTVKSGLGRRRFPQSCRGRTC